MNNNSCQIAIAAAIRDTFTLIRVTSYEVLGRLTSGFLTSLIDGAR